MLQFLEHFGIAVNAIAGALAARGRRVDLFGVIVLALVTAFGGGTVRDLCLGATPV
ncbi:MAG: TRIC cation channel family protein, partial [Verrucomicrobia bacterium]|nr:TRIC cation channel family protein [Verrucomicrobiota bacterium]